MCVHVCVHVRVMYACVRACDICVGGCDSAERKFCRKWMLIPLNL